MADPITEIELQGNLLARLGLASETTRFSISTSCRTLTVQGDFGFLERIDGC